MSLQPTPADVLPVALRALERSLVGVQTTMELEMDELGELSVAALAVKGLFP